MISGRSDGKAMMNDIRMVAIDLDGTLLTDEKKILEEDRKAISEARRNGCRIVLCSGRTRSIMVDYIRDLGFDQEGEYTIESNGGSICDEGTQKSIYSMCLSPESVRQILQIARENDNLVNPQMYLEGKLLVDHYVAATEMYEKLSGNKAHVVPDLADLCDEPMQKIVFCSHMGVPEKDLQQLQKRVEEVLPENVAVWQSASFLLDFVSKYGGKWNAVRWLSNYLNIPTTSVMCIGDQENDAEMIKEAGIGACPANASEAAKSVADIVAENSNNECAVAEILKKAGLCRL